MSSSDAHLSHLVHVLDARGTGLGWENVAWAFQDPETRDKISEWVDEYLYPDILLTREELTFYEKHGVDTSGSTTGPQLSDEDFEFAISSLEASTASIEKQCRLLESQKQALREIQARNASSFASDAGSDQKPGKHAREKAQLEFEAAELADSLQVRIERATKQAESSTNGVLPMVERLLVKDDRLLDGLEKVLPNLTGTATDSSEVEEVDRLCQALTLLTTQEVHARIDATHNAAVRDYSSQTNGHRRKPSSQSLSNQRDALKAELEELCREIDGLSAMAVENQYRTSISRALHSAMSDNESDQAAWAEYMSSALQYLTARLEATDDVSQDLRAHSSAVAIVSAAFRGTQAAGNDSQSAPKKTQSPVKPSQKGLKPLRLVQANLSESHDPASQLLRQLDVRVADQGDSYALAASTNEKLANLSSLATVSERGIIDQVAMSLAKADTDVQTLLSTAYVHSRYGTVRLTSQEATEGIWDLEQKTQELSEQMRGLDVDEIARDVRKKQQVLLR